MKIFCRITQKNVMNAIVNISLLLVVLIFPSISKAQTVPPSAITPGTPGGSYPLDGFDAVNLFNGNLNFNLPLLKTNGRGEVSHNLSLTLETQWGLVGWGDSNGTYYEFSPHTPSPLSFAGAVRTDGAVTPADPCVEEPVVVFWQRHQFNFTYVGPDGTEHMLVDPTYHGREFQACGSLSINYGRVFESADSSFITFYADADISTGGAATGYLFFKNGLKSRVENGKILWTQDRNGNRMEFTYNPDYSFPFHYPRLTGIKDSINREINIEYGVTEPSPYGLCDKITYKGFGGQDRVIRISRDSLSNLLRTTQSSDSNTLKTIGELFNDDSRDDIFYSNPDSYFDGGPGIKAVWLPDGRSYQFKYNVYGRLARVVIPTGGATEYDYGPVDIGVTGGNYYVVNRIAEQRTYDDTNNLVQKKVFIATIGSSGTVVDVEQLNPTGTRLTKSKHYFNGAAQGEYSYSVRWNNGKEYKTEVFDSDGSTLLRKIETDWRQRTASWCSGSYPGNADPDLCMINNPFVIETRTTLADANLVTKTSSVDPVSGIWAVDSFNNQTDLWYYDYGLGQPENVLKRTHTDYVTDVSYTGHTGSHLRGLPLQTWISSDSAGNNKVSLTQFEYDNYTPNSTHAPLVSRISVTGHDTTNAGTGYVRRGNITAVTSYADAGAQSGAILTYLQYDILGNVVKTIDANGFASTLSYSDNFGSPDSEATVNSAPMQLSGSNTFAFPTGMTNPLGWTVNTQYDYFLGAPVNTRDLNGRVSKVFYNDPLDRPTQSVSAINVQDKQMTVVYDDVNRTVQTTTDFNAFNDNHLKNVSLYDGFGRITEKRSYEADGDYSAVQTQYDALGRPYKVSNPFRPTEIDGSHPIQWSETSFDALGNVSEVETPDGAKVKTSNDGNRVLVVDQADRKRITKINALGQLTDAWEVTSADSATVSVTFPGTLGTGISAGYHTSYGSDTLGNLVSVTQGGQTRTFSYDSLSRLSSSTNPESGAVSNTYDANGNIKTKRDARGIKTIYDYDSLNRIVKICYRVIGSGSLGATACNQAGSEQTDLYLGRHIHL
jgi:YD repeat-containing protein